MIDVQKIRIDGIINAIELDMVIERHKYVIRAKIDIDRTVKQIVKASDAPMDTPVYIHIKDDVFIVEPEFKQQTKQVFDKFKITKEIK